MFKKISIDYLNNNLFTELSESVNFETICKGRKGAILVNIKNNLIPIVRTTTKYKNTVQKFMKIHENIMEEIKKHGDFKFNNAMIEIYDSDYSKMKFHSDQSLDLEKESYICIFSCYKDKESSIRTLEIK